MKNTSGSSFDNKTPRKSMAGALVFASLVLVSPFFSNSVYGPISTSAASVAVPACSGSNLVGALVKNQVGTGHVVTTIAISNVGTKTCKLGGYPTLLGFRGTRKYHLRVTSHETYGGNLRPTDLAPRMSGALIVGTGDLCGPSYGVLPPSQVYSRDDRRASEE